MVFYAPAQLIRETRRVGVEVRPATVTASNWDCILEFGEDGWTTQEAAERGSRQGAKNAKGERLRDQAQTLALRLGLRLIKGLSRTGAERLVAARSAAA